MQTSYLRKVWCTLTSAYIFTKQVLSHVTCELYLCFKYYLYERSKAIMFWLFLFQHSIYYLRPSFSLPPSRDSDPGSHSGLSPLPTTAYVQCIFILLSGEGFSPSSSTRVESRYPFYVPVGALGSWLFVFANSLTPHSEIQTPGLTLLIALKGRTGG